MQINVKAKIISQQIVKIDGNLKKQPLFLQQKKIIFLNLQLEKSFHLTTTNIHDNETRHDCHFGLGKPRKHRTCQSHPRPRRL